MTFNLAIDIGNSRTKVGLFQGRELIHLVTLNNDELEGSTTLLDGFEVEHAIISSVNKEAEEKIKLEGKVNSILYLTHKTPLPISLDYQSPDTLGKDRIAAVVGAQELCPHHPLLVIDAGTCITYDFLTAEKRYLGGAISPGIQMRLRSMNNFTNQLPLIHWEGETKPQSIGNTTITSMLSGVVNGLISEMTGFIADYERAYPELKVVLTGGDSNFFEKELKNGIFADPNLVLKGLNEILIYQHN